jgi:PIN domain nuclease of toxin-antitoxin system
VILLLDAHALLWWIRDDPDLLDDARTAIASELNDVLVSALTVWEIETKRALGRLDAPGGLVDAIEQLGFDIVPVTGRDAERAAALPFHHRDPFDRMLVAQAMRLDAVLVSRDAALDRYGIEVLRS